MNAPQLGRDVFARATMSTVTLKPNPKPATSTEDRTSCFAEWSSEDVADFLAELGELGGPGFSETVVRAMRGTWGQGRATLVPRGS